MVYLNTTPGCSDSPRKKRKDGSLSKKDARAQTKEAEALRIADLTVACDKVSSGEWTQAEAVAKLPRVKDRTLCRWLTTQQWRNLPATLARGRNTHLPPSVEVMLAEWLVAMTRIGQAVPKALLISKVRAIYKKLNGGAQLKSSLAKQKYRQHESYVEGFLTRYNKSTGTAPIFFTRSNRPTNACLLVLQICMLKGLLARRSSR